jgi:hypothetical protein
MTTYVISINYGELEIEAGEEYEAAYREYGRQCEAHPHATVTLLENEEMIKEREVEA